MRRPQMRHRTVVRSGHPDLRGSPSSPLLCLFFVVLILLPSRNKRHQLVASHSTDALPLLRLPPFQTPHYPQQTQDEQQPLRRHSRHARRFRLHGLAPPDRLVRCLVAILVCDPELAHFIERHLAALSNLEPTAVRDQEEACPASLGRRAAPSRSARPSPRSPAFAFLHTLERVGRLLLPSGLEEDERYLASGASAGCREEQTQPGLTCSYCSLPKAIARLRKQRQRHLRSHQPSL
jgi:hypothetical protein